jgi:8-oxo-dGTP diphosphatase
MPVPGAATLAPMHVMAGVVCDGEGRVLLAQRPAGKHFAGLWEFPGGKLESGEAPFAGLVRELREELGLAVQRAQPLIRIACRYPDRELLLDTWQVEQWSGSPQSLEGQAWQWMLPGDIDVGMLTRADRAILQALRLPPRYPCTPAETPADRPGACFERLGRAISRGESLLQLRLPLWPRSQVRELASALLPLARRHGARLMLHGDIDGARLLGVGVQLRSAQVLSLSERPLPLNQLVGASCHDAQQLAGAGVIEADFATLSPLAAIAGQAQPATLGWPAFRALVEDASLPVYALGGVDPSAITQAKAHGGQGIAGAQGFWV